MFSLVPIDSFNLIDRYFAAFVCGTYLLFTAILSINIFIGLISNALQTEAFSTVEARFLLERTEVILNYEWRLSVRKRLQLQEHPKEGVHVHDLSSFITKNTAEIEHVMTTGNLNRSTG